MNAPTGYPRDFSQITLSDLPRVGGKNASLGEIFNALGPKGVPVLDDSISLNPDTAIKTAFVIARAEAPREAATSTRIEPRLAITD
ncbi:MAG TPA: hypothetical protein VMS64_17245 [Candidatus Methylomirabilis sp.]|nr:hypothetical protein [Candidatus Methylomirabilis sp.]